MFQSDFGALAPGFQIRMSRKATNGTMSGFDPSHEEKLIAASCLALAQFL
jgi:hypothetical protein